MESITIKQWIPSQAEDDKWIVNNQFFNNMAIIIDGKILASKVYDEIVAGISKKSSKANCTNKKPNLAIILVGDRNDSKIYVDIKQKRAKEVGIDTHFYKINKNESEEEVLKVIDFLNKDEKIDGILLQLPLPKHLNTDFVIDKIDSKKDVDRLCLDNSNDFSVLSPLLSVVDYIFEVLNFNTSNKRIGVVAKPNPFGNNLANFLRESACNVDVIDPNNTDFTEKIYKYDILITAIGKAKIIKKEMIKDGVTIIDMGIVKEGKKIYGDVDFKDVEKKVEYITPVPGGVGPLTVAFALKNTFELWDK